MERFVCIHGHFYQPPRENPWLEDIELQDSASPYHDWNERITHECYEQNAASRILDNQRKIVDIINNYSHISFNFGATLLYWLESHAPDVYEKILHADSMAQERFSGHGCALAQPYNHMIMPLANTQDMHTQVIWGIEDFKQRFKREPEGMWLPEAAVDTSTLETLAFHNIKFTILSPIQAKCVRKIDTETWTDVDEHSIDTSIAYICNLPSGKKITLFFYHGPVAQQVAYGGLLHSGEEFSQQLIKNLPEDNNDQHRLMHIATDGESFGHHHRHGDMALAYCLHKIETHDSAKITIYAEYLDKQKPQYEAQIVENSSWSCAHGIERWKSNCGCCGNSLFVGQQTWRAPLREALDWLRDEMARAFEEKMANFCKDPWHVRNQYINVVNNRESKNVENFISRFSTKHLSGPEKVCMLKLLEMQRCAMLMYTSCAWFFNHISGIETVQIMQYAARAMQLLLETSNIDLEPEFKSRLQEAPGNNQPYKNGREVYEASVEPARIDLSRVGAHVALSSVFDQDLQEISNIYCYSIDMDKCKRIEAGTQVMITGSATLQSCITLEQHTIELIVLYLGDNNLFGAARSLSKHSDFNQLQTQLHEAFRQGDTIEAMRLINTQFNGKSYSLSHLFKDQQRSIMNRLLENTRDEIEQSYRHIYEHNYATMCIVRNMDMPLPDPLASMARFVLKQSILKELRKDQVNLKKLRKYVDELSSLSLHINAKHLILEAEKCLNQWVQQFNAKPTDIKELSNLVQALEILLALMPNINLQIAQNIFFQITKTYYPAQKQLSQSNDPDAVQWINLFTQLADHLQLALP